MSLLIQIELRTLFEVKSSGKKRLLYSVGAKAERSIAKRKEDFIIWELCHKNSKI